MASKNREDTNLLFLNLVDDPIVADQDFPHIVTAELRDSAPGERLLRLPSSRYASDARPSGAPPQVCPARCSGRYR